MNNKINRLCVKPSGEIIPMTEHILYHGVHYEKGDFIIKDGVKLVIVDYDEDDKDGYITRKYKFQKEANKL